jgi:hypothetical protein
MVTFGDSTSRCLELLLWMVETRRADGRHDASTGTKYMRVRTDLVYGTAGAWLEDVSQTW